nr:trigger factor [uncultured Blautia sp.]
MKRKAYLAALVMCMALAVNGCGDNKETTDTENTATEQQTEESEDTQEQAASYTDSTGATRLVSVDNVEKYVTIADYKGITLDNSVQEVTDEAVENRVAENLKSSAEAVTDENATIQNGDTATINFVGTKDGEAFEGGTGNNYDLVIGSGSMIPGFEEGIVGMKKGETKDVPVTFPENYRNTELAGQDAVFQITVQSFKRPPELTDDWVAANTDYKTVDEYKANVRTQLEQEAQEQADNSLRSTAWSTVYTNSEVVEYPEKDVEEASKTFRNQAEAYAKQGNMELEDFVASQGVSMDDFEAQCQQYAQAKVKQDLIIQGIMDAEGMTLEDEESLAIQNQLVEQYASGDLAALIDTYGQVAVDESIGLIRVQNFIIANANYDQTASDDTSDAADGEVTGTTADTGTAADGTASGTETDEASDTQDTNTEN